MQSDFLPIPQYNATFQFPAQQRSLVVTKNSVMRAK
jgi:hypothetical protein